MLVYVSVVHFDDNLGQNTIRRDRLQSFEGVSDVSIARNAVRQYPGQLTVFFAFQKKSVGKEQVVQAGTHKPHEARRRLDARGDVNRVRFVENDP